MRKKISVGETDYHLFSLVEFVVEVLRGSMEDERVCIDVMFAARVVREHNSRIRGLKAVIGSGTVGVNMRLTWRKWTSGGSPLESSYADFLRHRHGIG